METIGNSSNNNRCLDFEPLGHILRLNHPSHTQKDDHERPKPETLNPKP